MSQTNLHLQKNPVESNLDFKQFFDLHKKNVFAMALSILEIRRWQRMSCRKHS